MQVYDVQSRQTCFVLSFGSIKEQIYLDKYKKGGKCRSKQDSAVLDKFSQAEQIYPLIRKKKLSKFEHLLEWTVMPAFALFESADQMNDKNRYYLAEMKGKQHL